MARFSMRGVTGTKRLLLMLLFLGFVLALSVLHFLGFVTALSPDAAVEYRLTCLNQPITVVEGNDATLQCHLEPQADLSTSTFTVKRTDLDVNDGVVYSYRNEHTQTLIDRITVIREDLTKGIVTLVISSVQLSDSGRYGFFIPAFKAADLITITVVEKDEWSRTNTDNSSSTGPTVENKTKTNISGDDWIFIVVCVLLVAAGLVAAALVAIYKKPKRSTAEAPPGSFELETPRTEDRQGGTQEDEDPDSATEDCPRHSEMRETMGELAQSHMAETQLHQSARDDQSPRQRSFSTGQKEWTHLPGDDKKLPKGGQKHFETRKKMA